MRCPHLLQCSSAGGFGVSFRCFGDQPGPATARRLLRGKARGEKGALVLRQVRYPGGRLLTQVKLYPGFLEQVHEGIISVAAEGYEALYLGID